MSPKAKHTTQGGGDFDQRVVPEGWYHVKVGWISDPQKPTGQYARGDETRSIGFDIKGGEYAGLRAFLAFGIPLYAALDDTTGQKLLNDLGYPLAYRLHPSSSAAKLSSALVGYDPAGKEEGEEVLSIPDAWMGAECEAYITNYTYQAEEGEKTINQVYGVDKLRPLQVLTAQKHERIKNLVSQAKEAGMEPEDSFVPFLEKQGIPSNVSDMVKWTETQADIVIQFLADWVEINSSEKPDEEVVMKRGW